MTDIPIPPEVIEAAAMQLPGMAGFPHLVEAAIRAGLRAWPGMEQRVWWKPGGPQIMLPLTENTNAET